jgi:hypothetical protein
VNVIGYLLMVLALGWFLYKLYLSYTSFGGTAFEMPVYDGAIYPPVVGVLGLFLVLRPYELDWSYWIYVALWVGLTILAWGAIFIAKFVGDREL